VEGRKDGMSEGNGGLRVLDPEALLRVDSTKDLHLENHEMWGSLACEVYSAHDLQARSLAALGMTLLE